MVRESTQKKLTRDRPPRVQIMYDVEVGDTAELKELPFVLGVLGDYSGHRELQERLKERKFVQVDQETFDDVLAGMAPRLALQVENRLGDSRQLLPVELDFARLEDFEPMRVVNQVQPLRQLLELRTRLADLRNKMSGNEKLEELLDGIVRDTEQLQRLAQASGPEKEHDHGQP
jgi:type VI secretion system protein ImpB